MGQDIEPESRKEHGIGENGDIDFVTLGMFIIDEIEYHPPRPPRKDVLGGAGSFSALGARLFSPSPYASHSVGWIVDRGSDFPKSMTTLIDAWETNCHLRDDAARLTTRAWNGYEDPTSDVRSFKYTTEKKRLEAEDLTPELLKAKAFHLICSPSRCRTLVTNIMARRKEVMLSPNTSPPPEQESSGVSAQDDTREHDDHQHHQVYTRPLIIWEPVPTACTPDELLNLTNCLPLVDICSPNHTELAGFMGDDGLDPVTGEISTSAVERSCEQLLGSMPLQSFTLVIRAGEKGCFIAKNGGRKRTQPNNNKTSKTKSDEPSTAEEGGITRGVNGSSGSIRRKPRKKDTRLLHGGLQHDTDMMSLLSGLLQDDEGIVMREEIEVDPGLEKWIPAYHTDSTKVVDPTGGGNTFLGGLGVAMARAKGVEEACVWGSVAASFAIEQVGVPILGRIEEGKETWNGVMVEERLREFEERIGFEAH